MLTEFWLGSLKERGLSENVRWEDDIKMRFGNIKFGFHWINLAHDGD
jgi:hypothetical protein